MYEDEYSSVLKSFTIGSTNQYLKKKRHSFTHDYWLARNYSSNVGGETIQNLIHSVDSYKEFISNKKKFENHKQKILEKISKFNFHPAF